MFRFFVCINLILVHVFCRPTEDNLQFSTDFYTKKSWQRDITAGQIWPIDTNADTVQSWDQSTTEQPLQLNTSYQTNQLLNEMTTEQPLELNTDYETTQLLDEMTTEQPLKFNTDYGTSQALNEITTEQPLKLNTDYKTSQALNEMTTEQPLKLNTDYQTSHALNDMTTKQPLEINSSTDTTQSREQITTEEPFKSNTESDTTQTWQEFTTEKPFEQENFTTTQQITSTVPTTSTTTCSSCITRDILEEIKKEIIDTILLNITREISSRLEEMEARLSALKCSNNSTSSAIKLSWQMYENLQIPLTGWLRVFDQPYSHKTRIDDLNQIAGICHNEVLVGATYNGSISLAAVGPASVLTLNTLWNRPQQFGQVYWYRTNGKSFGFSPTSTIRQTSADNEDLDSPLRLSWLLDQNMGGYRAGVTRSLADNSLWHKVIYCN